MSLFFQLSLYFSHTSGWRCTIGFLANYHHYGMFGVLLCNLCYGLKIVVMEKYDTVEYLRLIEWHRVSVFCFGISKTKIKKKKRNVSVHEKSS